MNDREVIEELYHEMMEKAFFACKESAYRENMLLREKYLKRARALRRLLGAEWQRENVH